jgi:hypothetical protein
VASAPALDVIVVSFACRDLLRNCLESLARHPFAGGQTVVQVVDNGSSDGTVEMVRRDFPGVVLHALEKNVGFSAANNLALRKSSADFVLLLNPDTEVRAGALDRMLEVMRARPDVGMAGCRLVQPDGSFDHAAKRSFPTPLAALAHFTGAGRRSSGRRLAQYRAPEVGEYGSGEVDAVNGAFMFVRREAIEEVGWLDEGYWLYMEDLDWCYRFRERGWKVWYEGSVETLHVKGGSSGRRRALRQSIAFHRGMGRFYRKFYARRNPVLAVVVFLGIGVKLAISLVRNGVSRADRRERQTSA